MSKYFSLKYLLISKTISSLTQGNQKIEFWVVASLTISKHLSLKHLQISKTIGSLPQNIQKKFWWVFREEWNPQILSKTLSRVYLLISNTISALAQVVHKIDFGRSILRRFLWAVTFMR